LCLWDIIPDNTPVYFYFLAGYVWGHFVLSAPPGLDTFCRVAHLTPVEGRPDKFRQKPDTVRQWSDKLTLSFLLP
jgi:hypothetical protein